MVLFHWLSVMGPRDLMMDNRARPDGILMRCFPTVGVDLLGVLKILLWRLACVGKEIQSLVVNGSWFTPVLHVNVIISRNGAGSNGQGHPSALRGGMRPLR